MVSQSQNKAKERTSSSPSNDNSSSSKKSFFRHSDEYSFSHQITQSLPKRLVIAITLSGIVFWITSLLVSVDSFKAYQTIILIIASGLSVFLMLFAFLWDVVFLGSNLRVVLAELEETQAQLDQPLADNLEQMKILKLEISELSPMLSDAKKSISRNAEFVSAGFIGLQAMALKIESIPVLNAKLRYSIHGHLPSYIRSEPLTLEVARHLYKGWTPERLIESYTDLINKRWAALNDFLKNGGESWDYFSESGLEKYSTGATDFDSIIDPQDERKSRFQQLKELNSMTNFHLRIFKKNLGSSVLLRIGDSKIGSHNSQFAILLDLRLPDSITNFEESTYGIFSESHVICDAYGKKIELVLSSAMTNDCVETDKNKIDNMLNNWIAKIGVGKE